ncbi:MAG: GGDEF domain-containing protein [Bacillota bacterium]
MRSPFRRSMERRPGSHFRSAMRLVGAVVVVLFGAGFTVAFYLIRNEIDWTHRVWIGLLLLPGVLYVAWIEIFGLKRYVRGMSALVDSASRIATGDLSQPVPTTKGSLTAELGDALENMRRQIGEQHEEIMTLNSTLEDQVRQRTLALEILSAVAMGLNQSLDVSVILHNALEALLSLFGGQTAAVFLTDAARTKLTLAAHIGLPEEHVLLLEQGLIGEGLVGRAVTGERTTVWQSAEAAPPGVEGLGGEWLARGSRVKGLQSVAFVTMKSKGRVLGALVVGTRNHRQVTDEEQGILYAVASEIGTAVDHAQLHARVKELASRDSVTGLFNHGEFFRLLRREVVRATSLHRKLSVLMLDVDEFKRFNDTYGHLSGDAALRDLGRELRAAIRERDQAARYGGEEFAVIAPDTDAEQGLEMARRIRDRISALGQLLALPTVSIGAATFPDDGATAEDLVHAADERLYRAKESGRNRVVGAG